MQDADTILCSDTGFYSLFQITVAMDILIFMDQPLLDITNFKCSSISNYMECKDRNIKLNLKPSYGF
jgi:hypothetical protein